MAISQGSDYLEIVTSLKLVAALRILAIYTYYGTLWSVYHGHNIPRVSCIFSVFTRTLRRVFIPRKYNVRGAGKSSRLPPMCPGFDSRTRRHMWVEFVVGSLLCSERFFSGYSYFPLSSKHFQISIRSWNARAFLNREFLSTP